MPDGFEPQRELERIITARDLIMECRRNPLEIISFVREIYRNPENHPDTRLRAMKMELDRGYGETIKQVNLNMDDRMPGVQRVITLPSNGRDSMVEGPVIDADV